jgi:energy-coupling factor transporter ATP-binding protein EcfA2
MTQPHAPYSDSVAERPTTAMTTVVRPGSLRSPQDITLLVVGETQSGKSTFIKFLHEVGGPEKYKIDENVLRTGATKLAQQNLTNISSKISNVRNVPFLMGLD